MNKKYKFELHAHTKPTSGCSLVSPSELVSLYIEKGYDGIVITNHYFKEWFTSKSGEESDKIQLWLEGYKQTKQIALNKGVTILLGAELRFPQTGANDYLFYGADEEFFLKNTKLYELGPEKMHQLALNNSFYFGQAHPCRDGCIPVNPDFVDGMEVYNGHPRANNHMDITYNIVSENRLISTAGTDFHEHQYVGRAAMLFDEKPTTSFELATMLKSKNTYQIIIPKEVKINPDLPFANDKRYIFE